MCGAVSVENRLRRNFRVGREIVCLCGAKRISKNPNVVARGKVRQHTEMLE